MVGPGQLQPTASYKGQQSPGLRKVDFKAHNKTLAIACVWVGVGRGEYPAKAGKTIALCGGGTATKHVCFLRDLLVQGSCSSEIPRDTLLGGEFPSKMWAPLALRPQTTAARDQISP